MHVRSTIIPHANRSYLIVKYGCEGLPGSSAEATLDIATAKTVTAKINTLRIKISSDLTKNRLVKKVKFLNLSISNAITNWENDHIPRFM